MAEKGETFAKNFSCLPPSKPNALVVDKPEVPTISVSPCISASRSPPIQAWQHNVNVKSSPPPQPAQSSFNVTSMITAFRNLFRSQKVEPTGIRPEDAKCEEYQIPVVYNKQYNIHGADKLNLPRQPLLFDKPSRVFSAIKGICTVRVRKPKNRF